MPEPATPRSDTDKPHGRRRRRWRRVVLGVVGLLLATYLLRQPLFGDMVAARVSRTLSEALGVPVKVDRIHGSWIADARIEQIRIDRTKATGALVGLDAESLEVHFDLWTLLRGDVVGGIRRIEAKGLAVELDLTRPRPAHLPAAEGAETTVEDIVETVPAAFPPIDIQATVALTTDLGRFVAKDVAITTPEPTVLALDAETIQLPSPAGEAQGFSARIRRESGALVWQSRSQIAGVTLETIALREEGGLEVAATLAGASLTLRAEDGGARLETGPMQVEALPPWVLRLIEEPLLRPRSGTLTLVVDAPRLDPLEASAELSGRDLVLPRETIRELDLSVSLSGQMVVVRDLSAQAGDASLRVEGLGVDVGGATPAVSRLERLDLAVQDLRAYVDGLDRAVAVRVESASPDGRTVRVARLEARGEGLRLDGSGSFALGAADGPFDDASLDLRVAGSVRDLAFGGVAIDGGLELDVRVGGRAREPTLAGSLRGRELVIQGVRVREARAEGRFAQDAIEVSELDVSTEAGGLRGRGRIALAPLRFEGVSLTIDALDSALAARLLPGADLPPLAGRLSGSVTLDGRPDALGGRLDLRFEDLRVDALAVGTGRLDATIEAGVARVATLATRSTWGTLEATGAVDIGGRRATLATLVGEIQGAAVRLQQPARVAWGDGLAVDDLALEALGGRLTASATLRDGVRGRVAVTGIDLARLAALVDGMPPVAGRATGTFVHGPDGVSLDLTIPDLAYEGRTGRAAVSIREAAGGLLLEELEIDAGALLQLSGSGRLPLAVRDGRLVSTEPSDARFALSVRSANVERLVHLPIGAGSLDVRGEGRRIQATLDLARVTALAGIDPLARIRATLESGPAGSRLDATLDEDDRATARLALKTASAWIWSEPGDVPARLRDVVISGTVEADLADARSILPLLPDVARDAKGPLSARLTLAGALPYPDVRGRIEGRDLALQLRRVPDAVHVPLLTIEVEEGELHIVAATVRYGSATLAAEARVGVPPEYDKDWPRQPVRSEARLSIPELDVLEDVLAPVAPYGGTLEGSVRLTGTVREPRIEGRIEARDLRLRLPGRDDVIAVPRLALRLEERVATIEALRVAHAGAHVDVSGSVRLPASAPWALDALVADVRLVAEVPRLAAVRHLAPPVPPVDGALSVDVTLRGRLDGPDVRGLLTGRGLTADVPGLLTPLRASMLRLRVEASRIVVEEAGLALGSMRARVSGHAARPPTLDGRWLEQALALRVDVDAPDLAFLRELDDEVARLSGGAGGFVEVGGTLGDPALSGALELREVAGALPGSLPSIDTLTGRIVFEGRRARLEGIRGAFGHGPFSLAGTVAWPRGDEVVLDLRLQGQRMLLVRDEDVRLRVDLDLAVGGPWSALETRGDARITDLVYVASMGAIGGGGPGTASDGFELFTLEDAPLDTMRFDVRVRASQSIRIRTNILRGDASADIQLRGTGRAPAPEGRISFPGLLVKLPFSSLKVAQGALVFPPGRTTDPDLRATAQTQMKGYELTVRAQGTLPDVAIRVTSVPPLSQTEAILLLSTGATSEELREEGLARAALTRIGSFFGKQLFSGGGRGPEDPDEEGFFDRFTFVQGREISRTGQETMEAEVRLTDRFYLRLERDRFDEFNAGVVWRWQFK